jgi:hypothetical protein
MALPRVCQVPNSLKHNDLLKALGQRYRLASKADKGPLLDEIVARTGYHRKHAVRLLRQAIADPQRASTFWDDPVKAALVVVWEATSRAGSRRLKALLPELVPALEGQGKLRHDPIVRGQLLAMSAATIDRVLALVRGKTTEQLLEEKLHNASEALAAFAHFAIPPDLPPDEQRHLQASMSRVTDAIRLVSEAQGARASLDAAHAPPTSPGLAAERGSRKTTPRRRR